MSGKGRLSPWCHLSRVYGIQIGGSVLVKWNRPDLEQVRVLVRSLLDQSGLETVFINGPDTLEDKADCGTVLKKLSEENEATASLSCVVFVEPNLEGAIKENALSRERGIPFIWAWQGDGGQLTLFSDLGGGSLEKSNPRGRCRPQDSLEVDIAHVSPGTPHLITCHVSHGLDSGDVVSIAGEDYLVEVVSDREFHAIPTTSDVTSGDDVIKSEEKRKRKSMSGEISLKARKRETPAPQAVALSKETVWNPTFVLENAENLALHANFLANVQADKNPDEISSKLGLENTALVGPQGGVFTSYGVFSALVKERVLNAVTRRFHPLGQWIQYQLPVLDRIDDQARFGSVLLSGLDSLGILTLENLILSGKVTKVFVAHDLKDEVDVRSRELCLRSNVTLRSPQISVTGDSCLKQLQELARTKDVEVIPLPKLTANNFESFWKYFESSEFDLMIVTSGSQDERRYIGTLSVEHSLLLIDLGLDLNKGYFQVIQPGVTESYGCSPDPLESEPPFCVVKSFPQNAEHVITWSKAKVENLLRNKPEKFNQFWSEYADKLEEIGEDTCLPPNALTVSRLLENFGQTGLVGWKQLVSWARNRFEKYFNHKALHLLNNFPRDSKTTSGDLFWDFPKRTPSPVAFDLGNDLHVTFVRDLALAQATLLGVEVSDNDLTSEALAKVISSVTLTPFTAKKKAIVTDKRSHKPRSIRRTGTATMTLSPRNFLTFAKRLRLSI